MNKSIGAVILVTIGIVKDIKKAIKVSSFLKIPWLLPFICLISFIL